MGSAPTPTTRSRPCQLRGQQDNVWRSYGRSVGITRVRSRAFGRSRQPFTRPQGGACHPTNATMGGFWGLGFGVIGNDDA